ncbi:HMG box-containing protein 4-like isoform X2 [Phymastichus coffea]|uniref:HMG box-containing protein 4-like isoform X2 n=1 Tax=Phymastichus coffea TaxID=108790 RepID=UPI00273B3591|nr:HMG box-containing protein 4-like isoform X2 [Phymastichus coffea]
MTSTNNQIKMKNDKDSKTRVSRSGRVCKKSSKLMYLDATSGDIKKIKSSKTLQQSSSSKKKSNIENVDIHNQTQSTKISQVINKSQKKSTKNNSKDLKNESSVETMETELPNIEPLNDTSVNIHLNIEKQIQQTKESSQVNSSTSSDSETYSALSNNEIETPDYTSYDEESVNSDEELLLSKNITSKPGHAKLHPNMLPNNPPPAATSQMVYTGYELWSNEMKKEILRKYPAIDINVLNVRLGEMWIRLSTMERNNWHSRARVLAQKNGSQNKCVMDYKTSAWLNSCSNNSVQFGQPFIDAKLRSIELEPIDVAAYLRLLGESLMLIGGQLQQRKRPVVTSDCITVLLDSLLCAMGSLICLTQQVPLLTTEKTAILKKTLENIAYVMPGL